MPQTDEDRIRSVREYLQNPDWDPALGYVRALQEIWKLLGLSDSRWDSEEGK